MNLKREVCMSLERDFLLFRHVPFSATKPQMGFRFSIANILGDSRSIPTGLFFV